MTPVHARVSRPRALPSVILPFTLSIVISSLLISVSSLGGFDQSEKHEFRVGFEGNTSVYRWANGYRELMVPTFNSSREARRSVVSGGLFSIVSFDNVPCNSDSKDVGTCYSNRECTNLGGTSSGICAGSFGTCCVVTATSGSTVTTNNTYFQNPDYPSTTSGPLSSSITVTPMTGATQLYIEFIAFSILGPSSGSCMNDTFTVRQSGSTSVFPIICGNNTGQAFYFPISGTGAISLSIILSSGSDQGLWKIRLVQFHSTDSCAAPTGCTQYYQDSTGMFETFNYNGGMGELINNYCITACFAVGSGNCGVLLTEGTFMLPGTAPNDCSMGDYLLVDSQKYCGDTLNNGMLMVNKTMSPYVSVTICTGTSNPDMDLGLSLNYSPFPCGIAG